MPASVGTPTPWIPASMNISSSLWYRYVDRSEGVMLMVSQFILIQLSQNIVMPSVEQLQEGG